MDAEHQTDASGLPSVPEAGTSLELARRARAGDAVALNELFGRYYARVQRIARIRMGAGIRALMESGDLVQQTCAVALRKLPSLELDGHASIIRWLAAILENQIRGALDQAAAEKRDRRRELPLQPLGATPERSSADFDLPGRDPTPGQAAADAELAELYDACVAELPGDEREVVLLREYAGAAWEEVAAALGRPGAHAAQQLHARARTRLARRLRARLGR